MYTSLGSGSGPQWELTTIEGVPQWCSRLWRSVLINVRLAGYTSLLCDCVATVNSFSDTRQGFISFRIDSSDDGSSYFHTGFRVLQVGEGLTNMVSDCILNIWRRGALAPTLEIQCIIFKFTFPGSILFHSLVQIVDKYAIRFLWVPLK